MFALAEWTVLRALALSRGRQNIVTYRSIYLMDQLDLYKISASCTIIYVFGLNKIVATKFYHFLVQQ